MSAHKEMASQIAKHMEAGCSLEEALAREVTPRAEHERCVVFNPAAGIAYTISLWDPVPHDHVVIGRALRYGPDAWEFSVR